MNTIPIEDVETIDEALKNLEAFADELPHTLYKAALENINTIRALLGIQDEFQ